MGAGWVPYHFLMGKEKKTRASKCTMKFKWADNPKLLSFSGTRTSDNIVLAKIVDLLTELDYHGEVTVDVDKGIPWVDRKESL